MIDTEKYVKIVSSQTEKPKTAVIEINNQDITITENGVYTADAGYTGIGTATVNVPQSEAIIESINITPTTSEQTITASGGTDGYSPITVSAVTSSIDANITAGNIRNGISILGVTGNVTELNGETVNITPTTSQQIIQPTGSHNGITQATVSAVTSSIDANIQAENIKSGISILGVQGNVSPAPAYYVEYYVNSSNVLTHSPSASLINLTGVQTIDDDALLAAYRYNSHITSADFSNIKTLRQRSMEQCFFRATALTSVNFSGLQSADYGSLHSAFYNVSTLTGTLDFSSFTTFTRKISSSSEGGTFSSAFCGTSITGINFNNLVDIDSDYAFYDAFRSTQLSTVSFPKVKTITRGRVFASAFSGCSLLTSLSFPALISTGFGNYTNQFNNMLHDVTGCTVHFPSNLQSVIGSWSDVTAGFGGTNTTVLFDLPATE